VLIKVWRAGSSSSSSMHFHSRCYEACLCSCTRACGARVHQGVVSLAAAAAGCICIAYVVSHVCEAADAPLAPVLIKVWRAGSSSSRMHLHSICCGSCVCSCGRASSASARQGVARWQRQQQQHAFA
jgi:hypothetical protein